MNTERTPNTGISQRKVYTESMIGLATFLGGPLAGGYLIAENFKTFDQADDAKKTRIVTFIATALIFWAALYIPDNAVKGLPVVFTCIIWLVVRLLQNEKINGHLDSDGEIHGWGRTVGIGLIWGVITFIIIFVLAVIIG